MRPVRVAFVMEQALGHVTYSQNLHAEAGQHASVIPTWLPIPFEVHGPARLVPLLRDNWSARASWRARRALGDVLGAQPHDAVFFHTQVTALFSLGIIRRLPTIVSLDATPLNYDRVGYHYGHRPAGDGWLDRLKYRVNQRVFRAARGLVTWSEWARRSLVDEYGIDDSRIRVLAPGAARTFFELGRLRAAASPPPGPSRRTPRVLFVGGDFQRKGGPVLLESVRALGDRCVVDVVTQAAVDAPPNVRVHTGVEPNSERLLRLFAEADAFVLPSRAECLAVALMEAAAAGLPIVTTNVGALGEAVRPGSSGFLIPADDPRALRQALSALLDDAAQRSRMGRAGYDLACRRFDARRNARVLFDLLAQHAAVAADVRGAA